VFKFYVKVKGREEDHVFITPILIAIAIAFAVFKRCDWKYGIVCSGY
jgi:hypothetical protein